MHKKLISELNSLAHDILKMRDKDDVFALKVKASKVYEKISVLAYIEEYINTTPQATETKEELLAKIEKNKQKDTKPKKKDEFIPKQEVKVHKKQTKDVLNEVILNVKPKKDVNSIDVVDEEVIIHKQEQKVQNNELKGTLDDELQDTLSVDLMTELFTKVEPKKSLNDKLSDKDIIKIELNDRIAFVKHLFEGNESEFNKAVKTLNKAKKLTKAMEFVQEIKLKYGWTIDKIGYEERFIEIIERRFI